MEKTNQYTIVIPAFNEERAIDQTITEISNLPVPLEIIVVDDASTDKTFELASSHKDVRVIRHTKNRGYGAALKTGFANAKGDLVGFLDADGTYPPEYFPKLCTPALDGAELVIGTRMTGEDSQMPTTRRIGNFFFAKLLCLLGWQPVTDCASGMIGRI